LQSARGKLVLDLNLEFQHKAGARDKPRFWVRMIAQQLVIEVLPDVGRRPRAVR